MLFACHDCHCHSHCRITFLFICLHDHDNDEGMLLADPRLHFAIAIASPRCAVLLSACLVPVAVAAVVFLLRLERRACWQYTLDSGRVKIVVDDKGLLSETNKHTLDCN